LPIHSSAAALLHHCCGTAAAPPLPQRGCVGQHLVNGNEMCVSGSVSHALLLVFWQIIHSHHTSWYFGCLEAYSLGVYACLSMTMDVLEMSQRIFVCCCLMIHHRLNGSSSPVLTATCLSYGSLCDFIFFPNQPGGHTPRPILTQNGSNDMGSRTHVPFGVKIATFWNPWPPDPQNRQSLPNFGRDFENFRSILC